MCKNALVALPTALCDARYFLHGHPGARPVCLAAPEMARRLGMAAEHIARLSRPRRRYGLLVWDAYRAPETQKAIFLDYATRITEEQGVTLDEAARQAATYVTPPDTVFPHGTGGAVDLTVTINGEPAFMGTDFDEFAAHSATDWYFRHPPSTPEHHVAQQSRSLLHFVMTSAGFVPYPEEWWHFEWGTQRWAATTGSPAVLEQVHQVA
ncbi:M15 family metallopeptidase [Nocardia sp. NPDC059239]|uniref:M15 family metallopeptidase n=1 Tax=Nocardia sp. NPDC059239 TaxID=3346785 RepID=UPI003688C7EC